jgi:hypothetical protein
MLFAAMSQGGLFNVSIMLEVEKISVMTGKARILTG